MLKPPIVEEVRRRLVRNGFGRDYASRTARELEDHWNDLVDEALRQGCTRPEAEAQADQRLGSAGVLAGEISRRLVQTSWLGRHPVAGFAVLAVLTTILWWALWFWAAGWATGVVGWKHGLPGGRPPALRVLWLCIEGIRMSSYIVAPWLVCHVAQRYFCGWKPALWGCLVVAIHNSMHYFQISGPPGKGTVAWGYSFTMDGPELLPILTPLCVFLVWTLWRFRSEPRDEASAPQFCSI